PAAGGPGRLRLGGRAPLRRRRRDRDRARGHRHPRRRSPRQRRPPRRPFPHRPRSTPPGATFVMNGVVMNESIAKELRRILHSIAPETDPAALPPDVDIREELDIDSMDFLRYATAGSEHFGL